MKDWKVKGGSAVQAGTRRLQGRRAGLDSAIDEALAVNVTDAAVIDYVSTNERKRQEIKIAACFPTVLECGRRDVVRRV